MFIGGRGRQLPTQSGNSLYFKVLTTFGSGAGIVGKNCALQKPLTAIEQTPRSCVAALKRSQLLSRTAVCAWRNRRTSE